MTKAWTSSFLLASNVKPRTRHAEVKGREHEQDTGPVCRWAARMAARTGDGARSVPCSRARGGGRPPARSSSAAPTGQGLPGPHRRQLLLQTWNVSGPHEPWPCVCGVPVPCFAASQTKRWAPGQTDVEQRQLTRHRRIADVANKQGLRLHGLVCPLFRRSKLDIQRTTRQWLK